MWPTNTGRCVIYAEKETRCELKMWTTNTGCCVIYDKETERKSLLAKNVAYKYRSLRYLCSKAEKESTKKQKESRC